MQGGAIVERGALQHSERRRAELDATQTRAAPESAGANLRDAGRNDDGFKISAAPKGLGHNVADLGVFGEYHLGEQLVSSRRTELDGSHSAVADFRGQRDGRIPPGIQEEKCPAGS